jgi:hypothetical protein
MLAGSPDPAATDLAALVLAVDTGDGYPDSVLRHRDCLGTLARVATRIGAPRTQRLLASGAAPGRVAHPATVADETTAVGTTIEAEIDSVLPFLLLGPLAQAGYLDAIPPAFEAVGLTGATALFATALAATVVASPVSRSDPGAATLFAGLARAPSRSALDAFAARARPALPALDAVLATSLVCGHATGTALLLSVDGAATGARLVLTDIEGLFPMAWIDDVREALPVWRACGSPTLLVTAAAARPDVLRDLDRGGVTFVVDVPPTRHEPWRRLPGPQRVWTNDDGCAPPDVGLLAWASERLDELVRRLAPPGDVGDARLTNSAALASAYALGSIAWTLWRDRETAHPLLALDRFADLSARIRVDATSVRLWLPLGKRHADLRDHGCLADVPNVPWLSGRVVEFSAG